ncbi:hypothetical protein [Streptomyces ziwulingensis]|uniref:Bacterial EndoU nuclease domain-containing protein n=1 Tax=Streptomyces ziwulingensis TaxID=1045501 RepID=A0ABP9D3J4_9ACTN
MNYGSSIFTQPEVWWGAAETGGSLALMGLSAGVTEGALGLCLTGIGCLAGAPIAAVGAAGIGVGAFGVKDGVGRINNGLGKAFNEASADSAAGSGKAPDLGAQNPDIIWKTDKYDGWQHVLERHRIGGELYNPETKGAFLGKGRKVQQWIQQVVKNNPARDNSDGGRDGYAYEGRVNAGSDGVGILSRMQSRGLASNRAYGIRVVLNNDGSLRTAHPVP